MAAMVVVVVEAGEEGSAGTRSALSVSVLIGLGVPHLSNAIDMKSMISSSPVRHELPWLLRHVAARDQPRVSMIVRAGIASRRRTFTSRRSAMDPPLGGLEVDLADTMTKR